MTAPDPTPREAVSEDSIRAFAEAMGGDPEWTICAETSGPLRRIVLRAREVRSILYEIIRARRRLPALEKVAEAARKYARLHSMTEGEHLRAALRDFDAGETNQAGVAETGEPAAAGAGTAMGRDNAGANPAASSNPSPPARAVCHWCGGDASAGEHSEGFCGPIKPVPSPAPATADVSAEELAERVLGAIVDAGSMIGTRANTAMRRVIRVELGAARAAESAAERRSEAANLALGERARKAEVVALHAHAEIERLTRERDEARGAWASGAGAPIPCAQPARQPEANPDFDEMVKLRAAVLVARDWWLGVTKASGNCPAAAFAAGRFEGARATLAEIDSILAARAGGPPHA